MRVTNKYGEVFEISIINHDEWERAGQPFLQLSANSQEAISLEQVLRILYHFTFRNRIVRYFGRKYLSMFTCEQYIRCVSAELFDNWGSKCESDRGINYAMKSARVEVTIKINVPLPSGFNPVDILRFADPVIPSEFLFNETGEIYANPVRYTLDGRPTLGEKEMLLKKAQSEDQEFPFTVADVLEFPTDQNLQRKIMDFIQSNDGVFFGPGIKEKKYQEKGLEEQIRKTQAEEKEQKKAAEEQHKINVIQTLKQQLLQKEEELTRIKSQLETQVAQLQTIIPQELDPLIKTQLETQVAQMQTLISTVGAPNPLSVCVHLPQERSKESPLDTEQELESKHSPAFWEGISAAAKGSPKNLKAQEDTPSLPDPKEGEAYQGIAQLRM